MLPCPRCGTSLVGGPTCPACRLPLTGPVAAALWNVDQSLSDLDGQIASLAARRRDLWASHVSLLVELGGAAPTQLPAFGGAPAQVAVPFAPPMPTGPRREWTPRRVQNLLLTIGALLLVIATAIFTAVSWHRLGDGPQALILTAVAAGCATLAGFLNRRGLTATGEAISGICIGLSMFDADAAHKVLLPSLSGRPYWAVATAVLALVFAGLGRVTKARLPWIAGGLSALLPLLVLAFGAEQPTATRALLLALDSLAASAALVGLRRLPASSRTVSDLRACWYAGGAAAWAGGFTVPVSHLLYGLGGASLPVVIGGLVASGCAAGVAAWIVGDVRLGARVPARVLLTGASALTLVCAIALPVQAHVDVVWWAATVIGGSLAVLLASAKLPGTWRSGPQGVAIVTALVALSTETVSVTSTLAGQVGWIGQPWRSVTAAVAAPAARAVSVPQQFGGAGNLAALLVAAAMAAAAGWLLNRRIVGIAVAAGLVSLTAVVSTPELAGSYGTGLAVEGALAMVAAMAAALLGRSAYETFARTATVIALGAGSLSLAWSLALPATTAVVGCWLVVTLLAAASLPVPWREAWLGAAALAAGYAGAGVAHELGFPDVALGTVVAGVALAVAAALVKARPSLTADVLDCCAGAMVLVALALAGPHDGWLSWTMLVSAGWACTVCVRADRRIGSPAAAVACMIALTVLPAAQGLSTPALLTAWVALVALAVSGGLGAALLGREPSTPRRHTALALVASSLPVGALVIGVAAQRATGLTACLGTLCAVLTAAAAAPDAMLERRRVPLDLRAAATGIASALLLATAGSFAADRGFDAGATSITVAIVAGLLAVAAGRLTVRPRDCIVVEAAGAAGLLVAVLNATDDATSAGWTLAVAGLAVLLSATLASRRRLWPLGVLLLAAASWVWLGETGVAAPEPYVDPVAAVALAAGYLRRRGVPTTPSFTAYGPGLSGLLLPSLAWALVDSGIERPLLLGALATAVVIVGAQQGLRAPLTLGSATLVLTALRLMAPYETMVPRWVEVGAVGTVLLVLGATYEQRRRDVQLLRARYDTLL